MKGFSAENKLMLLMRRISSQCSKDIRKFLHQIFTVEVAALKRVEDILLLLNDIHILLRILSS